MNEHISPAAAAILEGLNEALADAKGESVAGLKKTTVYRIEPKKFVNSFICRRVSSLMRLASRFQHCETGNKDGVS